jgi:hypothetical protein
VLHYTTWRLGLAIIGSGALLLGLLYTTHGRGTDFHGQMPDRQAAQHLVRQPSLWLLIALFSLGISSTLGIYTMLPLYLVSNHGLDHGSANTLLAVSRIATLPMAFAGGMDGRSLRPPADHTHGVPADGACHDRPGPDERALASRRRILPTASGGLLFSRRFQRPLGTQPCRGIATFPSP